MSQVIQIDPEIQGGTPCFSRTRVPVKTLFDYLARGRSLDYFHEQFPSVTREQSVTLLEEARKLVILTFESNDIDDLQPLIPKLLQALNTLKPKTVIRIG